jgi:hypothetical protein
VVPVILVPFSSGGDTVGAISLSWAWIGVGVFFGAVGALVWEHARRSSSTTNCC